MIRIPIDDEKRALLSEGPHHFRITAAAVNARNDKPVLKLKMMVVAGPTPAGTMHTEDMHLTPDAIRRVSILAKRLGLMERGSTDLEMDLDEQDLVGKEVVAIIAHEGYSNKRGELVTISKWQGFADFWAPDDERSPMKPNSFARPGTRPASPGATPDWSTI